MKKWLLVLSLILCLVFLLSCTETVIDTVGISKRAQELYDFSAEALTNWEDMNNLNGDIAMALGKLREVEQGIEQDALRPFGPLFYVLDEIAYKLTHLYAPPDAVEAKVSLLAQYDLLNTIFTHTSLAAIHYETVGREYEFENEIRIKIEINLEYFALSDQNERSLVDLKLQAEQNLK